MIGTIICPNCRHTFNTAEDFETYHTACPRCRKEVIISQITTRADNGAVVTNRYILPSAGRQPRANLGCLLAATACGSLLITLIFPPLGVVLLVLTGCVAIAAFFNPPS